MLIGGIDTSYCRLDAANVQFIILWLLLEANVMNLD